MSDHHFHARLSYNNRKYMSKLKAARTRQQNKLAKEYTSQHFRFQYYLSDPEKVAKKLTELQKIGVDGSQIEPHFEAQPIG